MALFKSKYGEVEYYTDMMPGCCGFTTVSGVTFSPEPRKKLNLYRAFHRFLKKHQDAILTDHSDWGTMVEYLDCGDVLMTDSTKSKGPSIKDFCTTMKWEKICTAPSIHREHGRYNIFIWRLKKR